MNRPGFNNQRLPPPPPGWNRPWVHEEQPPHLMEGYEGSNMEDEDPNSLEEPESNSMEVLGDNVLRQITEELKDIIKKDLNKKVIESMAFKVYESWWDKEQALKNPKPAVGTKPASTPSVTAVKTEPGTEPVKEVKTEDSKSVHAKMPALLNTFDPLNWAKGSLEMDGFRIGLGFRSAISKMPSFRVKKRTPSPVEDKRAKLESIYRKNKCKSIFYVVILVGLIPCKDSVNFILHRKKIVTIAHEITRKRLHLGILMETTMQYVVTL